MLRSAYFNVEAWRARRQIQRILDAPDSEFVVTLNGRSREDSGAVLRAIRSVHLRMSHHTHTGRELRIVIRSKRGLLELTVARDSALPHEYRVFWTRDLPDESGTREIGRIETAIFDEE
jgi:succinate dehydrogenase flavin-adding protein (antitoxin of CptAB toxin-antitoxin module)